MEVVALFCRGQSADLIRSVRMMIEAAKLLVAEGLTDTKFVLAGDDQGRDAYVRDLRGRIAEAARKSGDLSLLRDDGFTKVRAGLTTLDEALQTARG